MINEKKAEVKISKTSKGGINIYSTVRLTNIDQQTIKNILSEFRIPNADVIVRSDITADQLIDAIESNNKYIPGLIVVNKIDIATKEQIEEVKLKLRPDVFISAEQGTGIDELKEAIYRKLRFMRVYCKRQGYKADLDVPMIMHQGSTLKDMCERLHKDFVKKFRFARVWGSSKFPGQPIRKLSYEIKDGDIVELVIE
jgi:ribosome-interacting GTPase 1